MPKLAVNVLKLLLLFPSVTAPTDPHIKRRAERIEEISKQLEIEKKRILSASQTAMASPQKEISRTTGETLLIACELLTCHLFSHSPSNFTNF